MNEPELAQDGISVLRLEFAADAKGTVEAAVVLRSRNTRREVANARAAGE